MAKCDICNDGHEYKNLGWHLGMKHGTELVKQRQELLGEEETESKPQTTQSDSPQRTVAIRPSSLQQVMVDAAKQMLDWKMIEMIASSKQNNSVREIAELTNIVNPPQRTSVTEMKEMFKIFQEMQPEQEEEEEDNYIETPNEWVNVAQQVVPLIKDYLAKKAEVKQNGNERINSGIKGDIDDANKVAESNINKHTTTGTNATTNIQ